MTCALGRRIGCRSVETVEHGDLDAVQLTPQVGGKAALVLRRDAVVLVELEHGGGVARQRAVRRRARAAPRRPRAACARSAEACATAGARAGGWRSARPRSAPPRSPRRAPTVQGQAPARRSAPAPAEDPGHLEGGSAPTGPSVPGSTTTAWLVSRSKMPSKTSMRRPPPVMHTDSCGSGHDATSASGVRVDRRQPSSVPPMEGIAPAYGSCSSSGAGVTDGARHATAADDQRSARLPRSAPVPLLHP